MIGDISLAANIYIITGYTDMRKSIDCLQALVMDKLHEEPDRFFIYLFCGRRSDRIKILLHESDGYVLLYKRLNADVHGNSADFTIQATTWQQRDWLMSGLEIEWLKALKIL